MKTRSSSAPRMQTVLTPRVKDGRILNDSPQKHYYGRTSGSFRNANHNYHINPENSPEKPKQYKAELVHVQEVIDKKIKVEAPPMQQGKEVKKINLNQPPKANKLIKQETIHGRKLKYPAPQRMNNIQNKPQKVSNHSVELMRQSSATSKHFVDRSIKSASIKQRKAELDDKFKVAFGYLMDANEAYLAEKRRACNQKARPKDETFRVMRPQINTNNHDQYREKGTPYDQTMQPQNKKTANSFGPRKVCGNSTAIQTHNGRQGTRAQLAQWPQGFKLQGPLYGVTNYVNHYPHHGDFQKMVPVATFNEHPLGMPQRGSSTHRTFYKGQHADAATLATWNNMHPYGNDFDPDRGTTYNNNYSYKQQQPIQQWPMYEPQLIQSQGNFISEAKIKFSDPTKHPLNEQNYCKCSRTPHVH